MSGMNPGFAAYLAKKKAAKTPSISPTVSTTPAGTPPMGNMAINTPTVKIPHQMVTAIKASRKGKLPPGLAKYIATHKKKGK